MWKIIQTKTKLPKKIPSFLPIIQKGCSISTGFTNYSYYPYVSQNSKLYPFINKTQNNFKFIQNDDITLVTQKHPLLLPALKKDFQITGLASFMPAESINDPINNLNLYKLASFINYFWFSDEHFMDPLYKKIQNCLSIPSNLFIPHPTDEKFFKHILSLKQHFICLINNNKQFNLEELMNRFPSVDFSSYNGKSTINLWFECYIAEKTLIISRLSNQKHVAFINHENIIICDKDEFNKFSNTNIFKPSESLAQTNQPFSDLHIYSHIINSAGECITTSIYKDVKTLYTGPNKGHITINTEIIKDINTLKAYIHQYVNALNKKFTQTKLLPADEVVKDLLGQIKLKILPLFANKNPDLSEILEQFNKLMDSNLFNPNLSALGLNLSKVVASLDQLNAKDILNLHTISSSIETLKKKSLADTDFFLNKTWVHPCHVNSETMKYLKILPIELQMQTIANFQKFLTL